MYVICKREDCLEQGSLVIRKKIVTRSTAEYLLGRKRTIRCPLCNKPLSRVSESANGYEDQKCRNCKAKVIVNLMTLETALIDE